MKSAKNKMVLNYVRTIIKMVLGCSRRMFSVKGSFQRESHEEGVFYEDEGGHEGNEDTSKERVIMNGSDLCNEDVSKKRVVMMVIGIFPQ